MCTIDHTCHVFRHTVYLSTARSTTPIDRWLQGGVWYPLLLSIPQPPLSGMPMVIKLSCCLCIVLNCVDTTSDILKGHVHRHISTLCIVTVQCVYLHDSSWLLHLLTCSCSLNPWNSVHVTMVISLPNHSHRPSLANLY